MRPRPYDLFTVVFSPLSEFVRWVLEFHGRPYRERPGLSLGRLLIPRLSQPTSLAAIYVTGEGKFANERDIFHYLEDRAPGDKQLGRIKQAPAALALQAETFFNDIYQNTSRTMLRFTCAVLLGHPPVFAELLCTGVPRWQAWLVKLTYPLIARRLRKSLHIDPSTLDDCCRELECCFNKIDTLLAHQQPFLFGAHLSHADVITAAVLAPLLAPGQYTGAPLSLSSPLSLSQSLAHANLPAPAQAMIAHFHQRPVGQWVDHLYRNYRPAHAQRLQPPALTGLREQVARWLKRLLLSRPVFSFLRRFLPVLKLFSYVIVSRSQDVEKVLHDDSVFSAVITAKRIEPVNGPFVLGMDRGGIYSREKDFLLHMVPRTDLPVIHQHIKQHIADLLEPAYKTGKIDTVSLSRGVPMRLLASYFGASGPDEYRMRDWIRKIFHEAFLNPTGDKETLAVAVSSHRAQQRWYLDEIARLEKIPAAMRDNTVLARMVTAMQTTHPWLTPIDIQRNINGMVVGVVDTTSGVITNTLQYLFKHPQLLALAIRQAQAGNLGDVRNIAWEASRFEPFTPMLFRYTTAQAQLGDKIIPPGCTVVAASCSAMFDPQQVDKPNEFRTNRTMNYLHFGDGVHRCLGERINEIQIPEILIALLGLPGLGRLGPITYDGPFADTCTLDFNPWVGLPPH